MRDLSVRIFDIETESAPSIVGAVCTVIVSVVVLYAMSLSALLAISSDSITACGVGLIYTMWSHVVVYIFVAVGLCAVRCAPIREEHALEWFRRAMACFLLAAICLLGALAIYFSQLAPPKCVQALNSVSFTPGSAALINLGFAFGAFDCLVALADLAWLARSFYYKRLEGYSRP